MLRVSMSEVSTLLIFRPLLMVSTTTPIPRLITIRKSSFTPQVMTKNIIQLPGMTFLITPSRQQRESKQGTFLRKVDIRLVLRYFNTVTYN